MIIYHTRDERKPAAGSRAGTLGRPGREQVAAGLLAHAGWRISTLAVGGPSDGRSGRALAKRTGGGERKCKQRVTLSLASALDLSAALQPAEGMS